MSKLSTNSVVAPVPGQVWCDMQGESAVIEIESSTFYGFEGVGTAESIESIESIEIDR